MQVLILLLKLGLLLLFFAEPKSGRELAGRATDKALAKQENAKITHWKDIAMYTVAGLLGNS